MNKELKKKIKRALECDGFVSFLRGGDYIISNSFGTSIFIDGGEITWDRKAKTITSAGADPKLVDEIKEMVRKL